MLLIEQRQIFVRTPMTRTVPVLTGHQNSRSWIALRPLRFSDVFGRLKLEAFADALLRWVQVALSLARRGHRSEFVSLALCA